MVEKLHWSDCALHRAPAFEPGPCDCGGYDPERDETPEKAEPGIRISRDLGDLSENADG